MTLEYGLNKLDEIAQNIIKHSSLKTYLFFGEMGVGKTTLIKALVKQLGSEDNVSSPTYSLVNEYMSKGKPIYHFDFYRINSIEEVYDIGFEEYLSQEAHIIIEWPELIKPLWPEKFVKIELNLVDDEKRKIEICEVF
ncbi:tRNA (adenosine(37)-N6)-threonylcarbamoyltransferase complex ATPase subunit type 1 TsaE [Mesohalobacter halotolerans]|uniref:tRNA threonylcarbamoyladenosine biosynthesis protein TsaE n=1 Tax=Mesohalobacter halotolerans TaxID=1883405 RepID=A0A4U5TPT1_9FLAO|nr:tRNA (adenosine(37)-N6)-threonylcarbamoyltransferase complex ATPase subunit type 1 TsaE [Mesohalobacter halotolerans]MBS3738617.1 tRNA (adenosine(37)-N6)-threonylcarbamoyltransferase complex ATPase subunit type 1 TsaE [Psychroflexus sp.]TKS56003.1 tRNA (adenosine(37)-N6)-threonylcarbamoyltransferase complex ATPase subunit type 1 TsaE [Mesohalobacter halotolerans]